MTSKLKTKLTHIQEHPRYGSLVQFVKFGLVGAANTLIALGVYQLCLHVFGWHYQLCNVVSFLVSVLNAYYWNDRFVFQTESARTLARHIRGLGKAMVSYGATFLLSTALLSVWVEVCGVSKSVAPVINLLITIPLNFVLNKFWTFRQAEKGKQEQG